MIKINYFLIYEVMNEQKSDAEHLMNIGFVHIGVKLTYTELTL